MLGLPPCNPQQIPSSLSIFGCYLNSRQALLDCLRSPYAAQRSAAWMIREMTPDRVSLSLLHSLATYEGRYRKVHLPSTCFLTVPRHFV